ncbi:MAG: tetratricopeptide repeat protein [Limisphaerales bacterium]
MVSSRTYFLLFIALLVLCFGLAASLVPQFQSMRLSRASGDIFNVLLGDSRVLFANHFYVKADEYYHSGYYPTIFDNRDAFETPHMAEDTGAVNSKNHGPEEGFLGPPRDWIEAFGRHFFPDRHTHLDEGGPTDDLGSSDSVREILPWLKLSADLDPDNVQTYTVTAFWLRVRMHKIVEADTFLHEGLRQNPDSYDILFELGRLYYENYHDTNRARNVWKQAVRKWLALTPERQKENKLIFEQITTNLGKLESDAGNYGQAVNWFQAAKTVSLTPGDLQNRIDEIKKKMAAQPSPTNSQPH